MDPSASDSGPQDIDRGPPQAVVEPPAGPIVYSTTPTPDSIWRRLVASIRAVERKIWSYLYAGHAEPPAELGVEPRNSALEHAAAGPSAGIVDFRIAWRAEVVEAPPPFSFTQFCRSVIRPTAIRVWGSVWRTWSADIATVKLQPYETASAAEPSIARYYAWRRSALFFSATFLIITSIYRLATFEAISDKADRWAAATGFFWLEDLGMTKHNAGVLLLMQMLLLGSSIGASLFCGAAAWLTRNTAVSRRWTLIAAALHLLGPAMVMAIPFGRFLDDNAIGKATFSSLFALTVLWTFPPVVLALLAGTLRSCFTVKTVLPESPLPGYVAAVVAPVYGMFFLTAMCVAGHFGFGPAYFGLAALCLSPMLLGFRHRVLGEVATLEELGRLRSLRSQFGWITTVGTGLLCLAAYNHQIVHDWMAEAMWKPRTFILQLSSFLANLVLLNVAASDVMVLAIRRMHDDYAHMRARGRDEALNQRLSAYSETS